MTPSLDCNEFDSVQTTAFLIVEAQDETTAKWFYADTAWQALDAAKAAGFDELKGFCVVKSLAATLQHWPTSQGTHVVAITRCALGFATVQLIDIL